MANVDKIGYTEEELEVAKEFLRRRLDNQNSMARDIENLLVLYAGYLLSALFRNGSDEDIELLINDLVSRLLEDCQILAVDENEKNRSAILLYMNSERNEDTLEGRVQKRCHTFFDEVFAVYTAGKILGLNEASLFSSVKANLDNPWANEVLIAAREKIKRGEVVGDLSDFEEPHFGKGVQISSKGALDDILEYAIADALNWNRHEEEKEKGAKGYYVVRGSSYPCDICDSHTGIFYPIENEDSLPQYHLHCCCLVVYSYVERL